MADFLDTDMPLVEPDPVTRELKATPYFEDYLYKIIAALGGEGAVVVDDASAAALAADKTPYFFGRVKSLTRQIGDLERDVEVPILRAEIKETNVRTANFVSQIKLFDYAVKNKDYIEGRNNALFTFPANPVRDDEIIIANGDGSQIRCWGNGYYFKYTSTESMFVTRRMGSSYHFQFFEDNDQNERYWRVR